MSKLKLTLSVDEELLKEARANMIKSGLSLSSTFEELLKSFTKYGLEDISKEIRIEIKYTSFEDIARKRGTGKDSGKLIRAMRDGREGRLS
jgi:hypothetical protein